MKYRINLITIKKDKLANQLLDFIASYLRYILVITQIVVIIVFFYKLKTDQEIVDLEESITQKQEIFNVAKPLIDEYLLYIYKNNQIEIFLSKQDQLQSQLDYLLAQFPKDVFLTKMGYIHDELTITGYSTNPDLIRSFYYQLQQDKRFNKLNFESITRNNTGFVFGMKLAGFK
jgi:Tfp pilus assembly protein PilN